MKGAAFLAMRRFDELRERAAGVLITIPGLGVWALYIYNRRGNFGVLGGLAGFFDVGKYDLISQSEVLKREKHGIRDSLGASDSLVWYLLTSLHRYEGNVLLYNFLALF